MRFRRGERDPEFARDLLVGETAEDAPEYLGLPPRQKPQDRNSVCRRKARRQLKPMNVEPLQDLSPFLEAIQVGQHRPRSRLTRLLRYEVGRTADEDHHPWCVLGKGEPPDEAKRAGVLDAVDHYDVGTFIQGRPRHGDADRAERRFKVLSKCGRVGAAR